MNTSALTSGGRETTVELPSDRETVVTRMFDGPARHVFDAWTKPEFVRAWYGLADFTMTVCDIDLRPGGRWRWVQETPDGTEIGFSGVYKIIDRPDRLEYSEVFEMMPGSDFQVAMTFVENGNTTTMTTRMVYQSKEHRDGHLQSGMEDGTVQTYLQLDAVLAAMAKEAEHGDGD
jgi:uncharacterized protein YndB with AHSA1/START domain